MLPDITTLSDDELKELSKKIQALISKREEQRKDEVAAQIKALADSAGLTVEIGGAEKSKRKGRSKLQPKFRHPSDPSLTWSGIGAKPKWLREMEKNGRRTEEFRI
ncbi:MAG: H-NS histone family protein [Pseudomonadales bacterium]|jgi:DNA-binding protein H-NS|nr:H-NS histone family protein [Pseudomonadales bacterium]MCP5333209.1 H-NS histone family protein [Pseudomonadales bacterium]HMU89933.1 H-NS histone family protein [Pseudomonadales bacterium]HMW15607.1 H-NS histone family protein [Pseudomonadales bacterium]HMW83138.1 H-NS histone family protein [Pseudomonadales bacterium]